MGCICLFNDLEEAKEFIVKQFGTINQLKKIISRNKGLPQDIAQREIDTENIIRQLEAVNSRLMV